MRFQKSWRIISLAGEILVHEYRAYEEKCSSQHGGSPNKVFDEWMLEDKTKIEMGRMVPIRFEKVTFPSAGFPDAHCPVVGDIGLIYASALEKIERPS